MFTENIASKRLGVIKTVVLACSKFKAGRERRMLKNLKRQLPRMGFNLGDPFPTKRIEIEDFGGCDEEDLSNRGIRPLDVSLEVDDGAMY